MKNYGLLGASLEHSLSPLIHQAIFAEKKAEAFYTLLEVPAGHLPQILSSLHCLCYKGINITLPYKKSLLPYFDEISPEAQAIGAANTVLLEGGKSTAHNTDYKGFGITLKRSGIEVANCSVSILGTGGASLAAAAYCLDHGVSSLCFFSRQPQGSLLGCAVLPYSALDKADIVINATPLGMHPNIQESPISPSLFGLFHTAIDLIYRPLETQFLKEARSYGLRTAGGLDMLIGQALEAQRIWNGWELDESFFAKLKQLLEDFL